MDNKDTSKLLLSIIMGVILILLLNVNLTNVFFHSFFTIVFLAMVIYHIVLNKDWIKAVTKNLTNKNFKTRYKVIYFLDLILALSFMILLTSEMFVYYSKNFLNLISWSKIYNTTLTFVLILVAMHVGIHLDYFIDGIKSFIKGLKNKSERKVLIGFTTAIIFVIAIYIPISHYAQKININNNGKENQQNTDNRDFSRMFEDEYEDNNGGNIEDFFGEDDLEEFFRQFEDQMEENNGQGIKNHGNGEGQDNSRF